MLLRRDAETTLHKLAAGYPVVAVTGPRQSGKTTLVRKCFARKPYVSLEELEQRGFASDDPPGFLENSGDTIRNSIVLSTSVPLYRSNCMTCTDSAGAGGRAWRLRKRPEICLSPGPTETLTGASPLTSHVSPQRR